MLRIKKLYNKEYSKKDHRGIKKISRKSQDSHENFWSGKIYGKYGII